MADFFDLVGSRRVYGGDIATIPPGPEGKSAYEVAVAAGFIGTEAEWLASLQATATAQVEAAAILHDYTHGIPLDRLAPANAPFDKSGETDERAKMNAAILSAAGETIRLPRKSRIFMDLNEPFIVPAEGMKIVGHDWTSQIKIYEDSSQPGGVPNDNGYSDVWSLSNSGPVWLQDLALIGDGENPRSTEGHIRFLNGIGAGKITLRRVDCLYSRAVAYWMENPDGFDMEGCRLGLTSRGGLQVRFSKGAVRIVNNDFWFTRDDSININWNWKSAYGTAAPEMSREIDVSFNRFWGAGGVRVIGACQGRIVGNTSRFGSTHFVAAGLEGDDTIPTGHLLVEGNVALDQLRPPAPFTHGSDYAVFRVRGTVPQAGGLAAIPGKHDPATGDYIDPEAYLTKPSAATDPRPAAKWLIFRNNRYGRKLKPGTAIRMWESFEGVQGGFADGWATYTIGEDNSRPVGFLIEGAVDGLEITRNVVETVSDFATIDFKSAPADTARLDFEDNVFLDASNNAFTHTSPSGSTTRQKIVLRRNTINMDPRQKHAARAPGKLGKWTHDTSNAAKGILFKSMRAFDGLVLIENDIANIERLTDSPSTVYTARGNVLYGAPVATGYHADNRGIGEAPAVSDGFRWVHRDSDPHSATYGNDLSHPPASASAMPSAGLWVAGAYVRNTGSDRSVIGWLRATTGTAHVAGTDWLTDRAASVLPILSISGSGNPTATITAPATIIRDTGPLAADKTLTLTTAPVGTVAEYVNETTGGFTRTLIDANGATIAATTAGQAVRAFATGATTGVVWKLLA